MNYKIFFALAGGMLWAGSAWGQAPAAAATLPNPDQFSDIMTWIMLISVASVLVVALAYMVRVNQLLTKRVIGAEAQLHGVVLPSDAPSPEAQGDDFWTRLRKKYWEDAVPIEREADVLLHHDYDGIRELDNSLPPWWINMFYLTILFSAFYMYYYHWGGNGPSSKEEYEMQMEQAQQEKAIALARMANKVDESSVTAVTEPGRLADGERIYKASCLACHGAGGEGTVGPNMTDEYWIHGGGIKNVFKTIKYGVPEKGMISWASQLSPADMQNVASYILTLQGTNPPNAKAPQGEIWKEK